MSKYEIRKDGKVYAHWDDPSYLPDPATLKSMKAAGYRLYVDGTPKHRVADDPVFHPIGKKSRQTDTLPATMNRERSNQFDYRR